MSCWAIIPVKEPGEGKLRLAGSLSAAQRSALVGAMLTHVVRSARAARNIDTVCLVGKSRHGLPVDLPLLVEAESGLNPALQGALSELAARGANRVVILHGDLPQLSVQDCELLAAAAPGALAIAPDRHDTGTNALSLPLPEAAGFVFAFGPDSYARHHAEADRLGLPIETIRSPGLARDIDEPDDLPDAAPLMT